MTLVYVAAPYSGKDRDEVQSNIDRAIALGIKVAKNGCYPIIPQTNTAHFEQLTDIDWSYQDWIQATSDLLMRCDAVIFSEDWRESKGCNIEHILAEDHGIPIYYYPDLPSVHPTEKRSPVQCRAFIATIMRMYRIHLDKNADYSPANILGTGEVGLTTRLWDKVARLMNLYGFDLDVKLRSHSTPKDPKNEPIDDSFLDAANYAIIGLLLRSSQWGK